jgi:hypothetical protein
MSIYTTTAQQAQRNFERNAFSRWHRAGAAPNELAGKLAFQRLRQSPFTPFVAPTFKIRRKDKLFAIGSCFARGIEGALIAKKMNVLSAAPEFASFKSAAKLTTALGYTNKYNTYSIYNELRWALDPAARFPEESIVDVGDGLYYDPHTNPTLELADLEETLRRRSILREVNARVNQCEVVIITLGLVEVWRDMIADAFVNTTPIPEALRRHRDRYEFQISSFAQNLANLEKIHALLTKFGHPQTQIIVTVSPVPLMATFSENDVVIANSYSKSLLRTAAQEWASAHTNVHYFPSYEIVQSSDRATAWMEDLRHVQGNVVNHIMNIFLGHYLE